MVTVIGELSEVKNRSQLMMSSHVLRRIVVPSQKLNCSGNPLTRPSHIKSTFHDRVVAAIHGKESSFILPIMLLCLEKIIFLLGLTGKAR